MGIQNNAKWKWTHQIDIGNKAANNKIKYNLDDKKELLPEGDSSRWKDIRGY
jgi:hypothetical protein